MLSLCVCGACCGREGERTSQQEINGAVIRGLVVKYKFSKRTHRSCGRQVDAIVAMLEKGTISELHLHKGPPGLLVQACVSVESTVVDDNETGFSSPFPSFPLYGIGFPHD